MENDIQLLIDQVNKLAMLPGEEIHVYHKNLKLMDSLKSKPIGMYGGRLESVFMLL
jgi:cell division protein FtsA